MLLECAQHGIGMRRLSSRIRTYTAVRCRDYLAQYRQAGAVVSPDECLQINTASGRAQVANRHCRAPGPRLRTAI